MKLIIVIMTTFLMQVSAITYAQQITLREGSISLKKVFTEIRRQTGYTVLYRTDVINNTKPVNLDLNEVPLEDALKEILKGQNLDYVIKDKAIFVSKKEATFLENIIARFRAIDVRGRVVDVDGNALPGATVKVKGKKQLVTTNANGEFALVGVDEKAALVITYIGYQAKEVAAKSDFGNIALILISTDLQEVVVNKGYYQTKKELETGNVSRVTSKEIGQQPVSNPLAAMQGRVPGIEITQGSGNLNGKFTVLIRGRNSLRSGSDPLYLIDGIPYPGSMLNNLNDAGQRGNPLNFINTADIESIDVLKDADATAIYGSRGANGVILITTKKGTSGDVKIDASFTTGFGEVGKFAKLMNTQQYLDLRNEAFRNDNVTPTINNAPDLKLWDTSRYTDWQKVLIGGTAKYTDIKTSLSGGSSNLNYLVSAGTRKETNVFPGEGADQKSSLLANINSISNNQKLKFQISANYIFDKNTNTISDLTSTAVDLPPDAPELYNSDGTLNWAPITAGKQGTWSNPLAFLNRVYTGKTNNLISNALISYEILPSLEIKTSFGYSKLELNEVKIQPTTTFDPGNHTTSGFSQFNNTDTHSWIIEPQLSYDINLGSGTLKALIGSTFQQTENQGTFLNASGFNSDALLNNIQAASFLSIQSVSNTQYKYNALFGRLNYNLFDKYLINLTARRDGTSRFGPERQFANFGALGAAWIFGKEAWIQNNLTFLSFGKLRASYGITGNDQIPDYEFLDLYSPTDNPYQGVKGLFPDKLNNPALAWESTKKLEVGLELGFLSDHVNLSASFYQNRSSNQLTTYALSDVTGFTGITANFPAIVQNKGWELSLTSLNISSKDFSWSSSANLTIPRNKLVSYPDLASSSFSTQYIVGQPLNVGRYYHFIGVDSKTGRFQFSDYKGNRTFTPEDDDRNRMVVFDPGKAYFYGGFQNTFKYKRLNLDILFQFVHNLSGSSYIYNILPGYGKLNQPAVLTNRWQKEGDAKSFQKATQNDFSYFTGYNDYASSDAYIVDASFIRLKNVSLSYALPDVFLKKLNIKSLRIFAQGQNLLTFTKYEGFDPESQGKSLPPLRVITFGLNVSL